MLVLRHLMAATEYLSKTIWVFCYHNSTTVTQRPRQDSPFLNAQREKTVTDFHTYHLNLLKLAYNNLIKHEPLDGSSTNIADSEFLELFESVIEGYENHNSDIYAEGEQLMVRLVRSYPHLTHLVARDLFWLFGGECMHYMSDDELYKFQGLDEMRAEAERTNQPFDYLHARTLLFKVRS